MLECCRTAASSSILVSELGARRQGCLFAVICCRRGACRLDCLGNRRRQCWVLCRRRNCVWVASFFRRLLCLHCGSRSRVLSMRCGFLFRCEQNPRHPPSC